MYTKFKENKNFLNTDCGSKIFSLQNGMAFAGRKEYVTLKRPDCWMSKKFLFLTIWAGVDCC